MWLRSCECHVPLGGRGPASHWGPASGDLLIALNDIRACWNRDKNRPQQTPGFGGGPGAVMNIHIATHPGPRNSCSSNKFNDPILSHHLLKNQNQATMSTKYTVTHPTWSNSYNVSANNVHRFHVDNSSLTPGKPDLTFHSSTDNRGPIAGTCKFRTFSSSSDIRLCSPSSATRFECKLQKEGTYHVKFWFCMKVEGKNMTFTWKRTSSNGRGYKLVDKANKECARFLSERKFFSTTTWNLTFSQTFGPDFEMMALMSGLTCIERANRSSNAGAAAAGAGGGGGGC